MAHKFINHSLAYLSTIPSRIPSIYTKRRRKSNEHSDSRAKQSLARDTWMTNNTPLRRRGRGRGRRGRYNSWLVIIRSVKQRWNMIIVIRATPGLSYFLGRHYHNGVVACTRSGHVRPGREGPACSQPARLMRLMSPPTKFDLVHPSVLHCTLLVSRSIRQLYKLDFTIGTIHMILMIYGCVTRGWMIPWLTLDGINEGKRNGTICRFLSRMCKNSDLNNRMYHCCIHTKMKSGRWSSPLFSSFYVYIIPRNEWN